MQNERTINTHPISREEMSEQLAVIIEMYQEKELAEELALGYIDIFLKHYKVQIYGNKNYHGFSCTIYQALLKKGCRILQELIEKIERGEGNDEMQQ